MASDKALRSLVVVFIIGKVGTFFWVISNEASIFDILSFSLIQYLPPPLLVSLTDISSLGKIIPNEAPQILRLRLEISLYIDLLSGFTRL